MRFKESCKEFGDLRSLVTMAMLLALRIALGFVTTIQVSENLKIGFTIFPTAVACMLFGPVPGLVMGGAADLIGFFIKPTGPYFIGYTLDAMVAGLIYGVSFYRRKKLSFLRVLLTLTAVTVIVNLCMTTTWISIQYGVKDLSMFFSNSAEAWQSFQTKFLAIITLRVIKNALLLPVNAIGVFLLFFALDSVPVVHRFRIGKNRENERKQNPVEHTSQG